MLKMLKVVLPALLLSASVSAFAAPADTAAPKIGIFDMQQMMQSSPLVDQLNKKLQEQFKPRQDKIAAMEKNLGDEINKLNDSSSKLTNEDRTKLKDKIVSDRSSYQAMAKSYQEDLSKAQNEAMQKLMAQLQSAVGQVAAKDGYTLVVQKGAVLYSDPKADVTSQVLDVMPK
ncbi:MAG TPA: OmpH family outer membrane protein [Gammaproteobacteria bacterium]|nr:OmpH family outer membrane protein [Gammaproteobacteria bacterium]